MILGTASHVGKSLLTLALCRALRARGVRVAPFKAVNIALNSWVAQDGGELAIAQAQQAIAAGAEPDVRMNPVLMKPGAGARAHLVVRGRSAPEIEALPATTRRATLRRVILESYAELAARYDLIVIEGSGSTAEINLVEDELSNLWLAGQVGARCVLVADVDRGGVFAAILGTLDLLREDDRARLVGFVVNKFVGDPAGFAGGVDLLVSRSGLPCLGVVPVLPELQLKDEDALALGAAEAHRTGASVGVAVVKLPHVANLSDFDALRAEPSVALSFVGDPREIRQPDLLILPGTRSTLADLSWLRERGWDAALRERVRRGGRVIGICGGMQMLGSRVEDPYGVEAPAGSVAEGVGVLPISTLMAKDKTTYQVRGRFLGGALQGREVHGYEIHMGRSVPDAPAITPLLELRRQPGGDVVLDGVTAHDDRIWGTYVHGLFDDDDVRRALLDALHVDRGLPSLAAVRPYSRGGYLAEIERWTRHVSSAIDFASLERLLLEAAPR